MKTLGIAENQEPNWDATDPNSITVLGQYGLTLLMRKYDVRTDTVSLYRDLTTRVQTIFGTGATGMWSKQEGRPSNDGRLWCLMVQDSTFALKGLLAYDAINDTVVGSLVSTDKPDHISTSPLGTRCVPSWTSVKGTRAYTPDFSSFTQLHTGSEHSDLAVTADGAEVYLFSNYQSGFVEMVDIATGARTALFGLYGPNASGTAMHISGTSFDRRGYAVMSFYGCSENYGAAECDPSKQWFFNKVVAVELKANPAIYALAHTQRGDSGYWGETQAVVNRDLTRVLFASSWGSSNETDISTYAIRVPACALP